MTHEEHGYGLTIITMVRQLYLLCRPFRMAGLQAAIICGSKISDVGKLNEK